jgi:tetratricopeptide (TPR) repeat protein
MNNKIDPIKIQELTDFTKENPDDQESWKALGTLYMDRGELLSAQNCFQKVLSINPDDIEAQVYLDRIIQKKNAKQSPINRYAENFRIWIDHEIPLWLQLLISLVSFVFIFLIALLNRWEVADMVWSLWITSLMLGYGYLLSGITSNAILNGINIQDSLLARIFPSSISSALSIAGLIFGALFQVLFFSIHFGLFHFVHSIFLNDFFPLIDRSFEQPIDFIRFITISLTLYWPVILFSFFATLRRFQRIFLLAEKDFMKRPYINVIKIHISIFLFAGISAIGFPDWILLLIFVIYFFPFSATIEYIKSHRKKLAEV